MIDIDEAIRIVTTTISSIGRDFEGGVAINHRYTRKMPYGWIFFYNARAYLDGGDRLRMLVGNGPIVVLASNGEVVILGTARGLDDEISAFEESRELRRG